MSWRGHYKKMQSTQSVGEGDGDHVPGSSSEPADVSLEIRLLSGHVRGYNESDGISEWRKSWASHITRRLIHYQPSVMTGILLIVGATITVFGVVNAPWQRYSNNKISYPLDCDAYEDDCESTAPLIFDAVFSLLKQWPNSYATNGHTLVPGTLKANSLLYHARQIQGALPKPTYFALDYDMSVGIYGGSGITYLHTLSPTKPLSILYLDGTSASLTTSGSLDSQHAILNGSVPRDPTYEQTYDENLRAVQWCRYLSSLGIDGIVRMNAGFEVMVCDYQAAGIEHLHMTNITVSDNQANENYPYLPQDPNRVPPNGFGNTFAPYYGFEWVRSATWRYGSHASSGATFREQRVSLQYCGVVTFYDPSLRSLSGEHRSGIQDGGSYQNGWGLRRGHRLLALSGLDAERARESIWRSVSLTRSSGRQGTCSGTDWQLTTELITDQHKTRLLSLQQMIADSIVDSGQSTKQNKAMLMARALSHQAIVPYWQYPTSSGDGLGEERMAGLRRCELAYTGHIPDASLNEFELILKQAIERVMHRICSVEFDVFLIASQWTQGGDDHDGLTSQLQSISSKVLALINYLGWDTWSECLGQCKATELCYIPMWPVVYAPAMRQGAIWGGQNLTEDQMRHFWQPKCLSQEDWDCGGTRGREPEFQIPDLGRDDCKYSAYSDG